jgi:hypothetical protein
VLWFVVFVLTNPRPNRSFTPAKRVSVQFQRKSPLYFQQLTNLFFGKSFPLKFMQIAPGGGGSMSNSNKKGPRFGLSPLELTLTKKALNCPNLQQITPLESVANLLSPLELTLTKNEPELTLTKYKDLKSHRITLLQRRGGAGYV